MEAIMGMATSHFPVPFLAILVGTHSYFETFLLLSFGWLLIPQIGAD